MSKHFFLITVTVLIITSAIFWFWQKGKVAEVKTVQVKQQDLVTTVTVNGEIAAADKVTIFAPLTGTLQEVRARENQEVKAGEILALFDKTPFEVAKNQAWAAYTVAKSAKEQTLRASPLFEEFQAAKAASDATQFIWEQAQKTHADDSSDTNKSALNSAYANYQAAWSKVKRLQNQMIDELQIQSLQAQEYATLSVYQKATADLAKIEVQAPQDGILIYAVNPVANQKIAVGQAVTAGQALFTLADLQSAEFVAKLDEVDLGKIQLGQKAAVSLDAFEEQTFLGSVSAIAPAVQTDLSGNKSIQVKIELAHLSFPLTLGLSGSAKIEVATQQNILSVPQEAVFYDQGQDRVWGVEMEKVKSKKVKVGEEAEGVIEVIEGLQEGETIVIEPIEKLKEGQKIKISNE